MTPGGAGFVRRGLEECGWWWIARWLAAPASLLVLGRGDEVGLRSIYPPPPLETYIRWSTKYTTERLFDLEFGRCLGWIRTEGRGRGPARGMWGPDPAPAVLGFEPHSVRDVLV